MIQGEYGYIYRVRSDINKGTFPPATTGNAGLLIGYSNLINGIIQYGSQIILTFNGNAIYKRYAAYNSTGTSWSAWTAV